jgi:hypothetical protein
MDLVCQSDPRRQVVRATVGRNGLDYVEVASDRPTLLAYFLGKLPPELATKRPGLEAFLQVDGGARITGLVIREVDPHVDPDPERDDYLEITLDRRGDFSTYTLRLVGVAGIDPRYDRASFSFAVDCPSELDCRPGDDCPPAALTEPRVSYLAKDYGSFRQLILDRLALLAPGWKERHVPDLGLTLVELIAYVGDYLSYYQDAVATEAYLGTARQRISVRRHARLVDYHLHEGCNARTWVVLSTSGDVDLPVGAVAFATRLSGVSGAQTAVVSAEELDRSPPGASYVYFEPMVADRTAPLRLFAAHNEIRFYTWGQRSCCLPVGATSATLLDAWAGPAPGDGEGKGGGGDGAVPAAAPRPPRALSLHPGDVLLFEEVLGPRTGVAADADPRRRHALRITEVRPIEDALYPLPVGDISLPTPMLEVCWSPEDALPFALCVSAIGAAPQCAYLTDVSVARGNVVLVDHGRTEDPDGLGPVPVADASDCCLCEGEPADVPVAAGRFRPALSQGPLTFRDPRDVSALPAARARAQDVRAALPALALTDGGGAVWTPVVDLLASGPDDRRFVAEIDDAGRALLRFGDGELGRVADPGTTFEARYRVGLGIAGNVGAEAISRLVLNGFAVDGVSVTVRNPLPATGGTEPEPIEEAKLFAPRAFRKRLERAITADDYARLAEDDPALQRAAAALIWTGSWYEADVAIDPLAAAQRSEAALIDAIECRLFRYRRMGHDLRVQPAQQVPIKLGLQVCVRPGYDRGQVLAALIRRFHAFFDPDNLSFGDGIYLSRIVAAAQALAGVECATVTELHRLFVLPNHELEAGVLPLGPREIAQLDDDPNFPEHGQLKIVLGGGR